MEQRISFVTLAVRDVERARTFWVDGLGWEPMFANDRVVMLQVGAHVVLSLWHVDDFTDEVGPPTLGEGIAPITLAHNVASPAQVADVLAAAEGAGATITQAGTDREWGGHSGYFTDPDGYHWEVAAWADPARDPTLPPGVVATEGVGRAAGAAAGERAAGGEVAAGDVAAADLVVDLGGRRVLFVMATDHEWRDHLRARFTPLLVGVGPIAAATGTTAALADLAAGGGLPDLVVSIGSAGSATLPQASVHQVATVTWRDMDATAIGFAPGVTPFTDVPAVIDLPVTVPGVPSATLSTGADIVTGAGFAAAGTDLVDMETYAVWHACQRVGVPLVGLRAVSDGAEDLRAVEHWTDALPAVDANLAEAVDALAGHLAAWATPDA